MDNIIEISRYAQAVKKQELYKDISKIVQTASLASHQSEPYQGTPSRIPATIKTKEELMLYKAINGLLGHEARTEAAKALSQYPSLANYFPEYSVANEALELAEQVRDELPIKKVTPVLRLNPKSSKNHQTGYSYSKYKPKAYSKPSRKKQYGWVNDLLKELRMGNNQNYNPRLKSKNSSQKRQYKLPHTSDESLEQKLERPYKLAA